MRDIAHEVRGLLDGDQPFALAVIARTWRSSPRPIGTHMAVTADGRAIGSLSGGCIEGAVYEAALEVIATGRPSSHHYGVSGEDALRLGLTCGGEIDVTIGRVDPTDPQQAEPLRRALAALATDEPVVLVEGVRADPDADPDPAAPVVPGLGRRMLVSATEVLGTLGDPVRDEVAVARARDALGVEAATLTDDDLQCTWAPPSRVVVFGAIDFARAVARLAKMLGHRVTVCDARPVFATPERFPEADELAVEWPHRWLERETAAGRITPTTTLLVLTHDPKFDVPLLEVALRGPAGYIGAMGSRKTTRDREAELRARGLSDSELGRLCAPIGLDLNARTPEETAVSIMAEVIALREGGTGRRLSATEDAIHHD